MSFATITLTVTGYYDAIAPLEMVLRKAAVALLILRIIANRRSYNAASITQSIARVRVLLSKYPLLASFLSSAEQFAVVLLQYARRQAARAAVAVTSKLQDEGVAGSSCAQALLGFLKKAANFLFQLMIKFDSALKTLAPFARYRMVCSVVRRKKRLPPSHARIP